jgi:SAM-dependent methyltransferase
MSLPPLAPSARLRWDVVERRLADLPPNPRILELGAGSGAAAVRLALLGDYVGVEPDEESNRTARSRLPSGATLFSTIDDVDDHNFDLVCSFEVLEHLEDDQGELQRWVKHVKPGGMVVVSVPAHSHRFAAWDERVGHFRRYDPADLVSLLESAGLVDVTVQTYGFPISYVLERVRNIIAAREARTAAGEQQSDMATRTAGSGRLLQPPMWASRAIDFLTWPFRLIQRATHRTNLGTGMVGRGRVPS